MTVKELKEILASVSDDTEVTIADKVYCTLDPICSTESGVWYGRKMLRLEVGVIPPDRLGLSVNHYTLEPGRSIVRNKQEIGTLKRNEDGLTPCETDTLANRIVELLNQYGDNL